MLTVSNTANNLLGSRGRFEPGVPLQIPKMLPEVVDREIVLPRPRDRRASRRVVRLHDASAAVASSGHRSYLRGGARDRTGALRERFFWQCPELRGRPGDILETQEGTPANLLRSLMKLAGCTGLELSTSDLANRATTHANSSIRSNGQQVRRGRTSAKLRARPPDSAGVLETFWRRTW